MSQHERGGAAMERTVQDALIGRVVDGRYEIEQHVGSWSMGNVYRASHQALGRPVELYVLRSELCEDVGLLELFKAEARSASQLDHPAAVGVFDSGWIDDAFFFVCEHVVADSFRGLLDEHGRLPWRRVRGLALQLCDALETFHRQGILHCALEPANILVGRQDDQDVLKVRNFGTHVVIDAIRHSPPIFSGDDTSFGAPAYMAPEQAQGLPATERTDVYGAATCLYEALTGNPPVEGKNFQQIVSRILTRTPPAASEAAPDNVPAAVDEVLRKALARSPESRFRTMAEFAAALLALPPSLQPKDPCAGAPALSVEDAETPVAGAESETDLRKTLVAVGPGPMPEAKPRNPLRQTLVAPQDESGSNLRRTQLAPQGQFMGFSVPETPQPEASAKPLARPVVTPVAVEASVALPKSRTPLIVGGAIAACLVVVATMAVFGNRSSDAAEPATVAANAASAAVPEAGPAAQPAQPPADAVPEPASPAQPDIDPANLAEALEGPQISSGFKSAEERIATDCGRHPGTRVEIIAKISGDGSVATVEPARGQDSALARCVTEAVRKGARFEPFARNFDTFRWTYRL